MEHLLSMGFSVQLAEQALSATGGDSPTKAIDWILSQPQLNDTKINVVSTRASASSSSAAAALKQSPRSSQANLHRFFNVPSKCPQNDDVPTPSPDSPAPSPTPTPPQNDIVPTHSKKRLRPSPPPPPLSERMRPRTLDDVVGQEHLLSSKSSLLRSAVDRGRLPSLVLWGPPGSGKTSIARAIIGSLSVSSFRFVSFSAVTSGVKDVRDAVDEARREKAKSNTTTLLFVDEVHRFNKSQQDSFLPIIEDGSVVFVGATTENPSFHLTTPLLSRCRLLLLQPLQPHHLSSLLHRAVDDPCNGIRASVGAVPIRVDDDAIHFISNNCDGDARVALNALEIATVAAAASSAQDAAVVIVSLEDAKEALQCKHLAYDKGGEEHYNCISALHKSMRGNDANAGIYWLARMLEGGEQPLYIARRLIRFASEDVGLADPLALNQAVACYQACHFLGMPECNVILAQCVAYLALAPKSVAIYRAIGAAQKAVKESDGQNEGVPLHLRNAPTKLMKEIGYGKDYIYTPDNPSAFQSYLPPSLEGRKFLDWPTSDETPLYRC